MALSLKLVIAGMGRKKESFPTRTFDTTGNPLKIGFSDKIVHVANNLSTQLSDAILVKLIKQWSSLNENQLIEIQKIIENPKSL